MSARAGLFDLVGLIHNPVNWRIPLTFCGAPVSRGPWPPSADRRRSRRPITRRNRCRRRVAFLHRQEHVGHSGAAMQHGPTVDHDDDDRDDREQVVLPGLDFRPGRAVALEMEDHRDEQAASSGIEHRGHDHAEGEHSEDVRAEAPGTLRGAAEPKGREMPQPPCRTEDQARPQWSEPLLQQRQGNAAPAKLLDRSDQSHDQQGRQHAVPRRTGTGRRGGRREQRPGT